MPWAVPLTAPYLWLFWRYAQGAGWPRSTAEARRTNLRANRLSEDVWGSALLAGGLGLVSLVLFMRDLNRLVTLPPQQTPDPSRIPFVTVLSWFLMGSVVAGIVEEASFRGSFSVVAVIYGVLAYLTNSSSPGLVLHAGGNVLAGMDLLARGQAEWQASSIPAPLIWETGPDASFWIGCVAVVIVGTATIWAYIALARVASHREWHSFAAGIVETPIPVFPRRIRWYGGAPSSTFA